MPTCASTPARPRVLVMTRSRQVNARGYRYPLLLPGCTGVPGLRPGLPGLRVPGATSTTRRSSSASPGPGPVTRPADGGVRGDRRGHAGGAGCRFFAGYPMTPFTEVLEHMARKLPARRRRVHERRERARGGRAWSGGRRPPGSRRRPVRPGQGLSLMQESLAEMTLARVPLVVLNMARGTRRLLPVHPRRRSRRLPARGTGAG